MRQSARILRQALERIPEGELMPAKVPKVLKPAANEAYARVESARGELGVYVIADGSPKPYRARCRTGSFTAMSIIVASGNAGARRLYERTGYVETARRPVVKGDWDCDSDEWVLLVKRL